MIYTQVEASLPHAIVVANHTPPTLGAFEVQGLEYRAARAIRCSSTGAAFPRANDVAARLVAAAARVSVRPWLEVTAWSCSASKVSTPLQKPVTAASYRLFRATLGGCCVYGRSNARPAGRPRSSARPGRPRGTRTAPGYDAVDAWGCLDVARWLRAPGWAPATSAPS